MNVFLSNVRFLLYVAPHTHSGTVLGFCTEIVKTIYNITGNLIPLEAGYLILGIPPGLTSYPTNGKLINSLLAAARECVTKCPKAEKPLAR